MAFAVQMTRLRVDWANICLYAGSMSIGEGEAASELLLAVESYRSRPAVELSGAQLGEELVRLRHVVDLLEVEFAKLSGRFAETDEWDGGGFFSPIHWIRVNCHLGGGAAADRITVGEQLAALPLSAAALEEGGIGFSHLALLAGTCAAVVDGPRPLDEGRLLGKGLELTVSQFRKACQHERHAADPGGFAEDERLAAEERKLTLSTFEDGGLFLKGVFDPAGGAAIRNALEPLARKCGKHDERQREQRLADALVELAGHALDSGVIPDRGSQRPHLQVTTSLETLLGLLGAPAADLEFSLPISSKVVERLACDCNVTRVLLDADSTVIDVGRSKRLVSGASRKALNVRDRHCRWPGCDRPASWSQAHHLKHWVNGGSGDLPNLVLLCHRHHWMVHEGRWQLVKQDDGNYLTIPPPYRVDQWARAPGRSWVA
jgi:Domain of unknown function (DUF222)